MHNTDNVSVDSYVTMKKLLNSRIASLESQLREKDEHYRKLEVVANRWHNEYLRLESEKDEEIQSCIEQRDNVLNDFELYRAEKDKQIEAFKDIENIRSQATKSLCKENYNLRDEIERLKEHVVKLSSAVRIVMDHFPNEILRDQFGEDHQRWIDAVK